MLGGETPAPTARDGGQPLLEVEHLSITLNHKEAPAPVVSDVSLTIHKGEIVGVVGESGSGKSMTALAVLGLLPTGSHQVEGAIRFEGRSLLGMSPRALQRVRGAQISMVFQEPMTALDPVFTVGQQLVETVRAHRNVSRRAASRTALDMLEAVGIPAPGRRFHEYPHQLSGGMRQRVMVAMALVCEPKLLIADEPTTAVDVTIQAQILQLIHDLSAEMGTAVMFITHDLGVVAELCSKVVTLYCGQSVEEGATREVLTRPLHPYTADLMQAIPRIEAHREPLTLIPGRIPPIDDLPGGCLYHPRCRHATESCARVVQDEVASGDRIVRCFRSDELELVGGIR